MSQLISQTKLPGNLAKGARKRRLPPDSSRLSYRARFEFSARAAELHARDLVVQLAFAVNLAGEDLDAHGVAAGFARFLAKFLAAMDACEERLERFARRRIRVGLSGNGLAVFAWLRMAAVSSAASDAVGHGSPKRPAVDSGLLGLRDLVHQVLHLARQDQVEFHGEFAGDGPVRQ